MHKCLFFNMKYYWNMTLSFTYSARSSNKFWSLLLSLLDQAENLTVNLRHIVLHFGYWDHRLEPWNFVVGEISFSLLLYFKLLCICSLNFESVIALMYWLVVSTCLYIWFDYLIYVFDLSGAWLTNDSWVFTYIERVFPY